MNAEDLKNSILQLAIQGKLVEQREEEGTAEELYERIQTEKEKLIEEGTIRRQQKLPDITEEEIPFDIPETWKWVKLGNVCNYGSNQSVRANEIPDDAWLLELEDIEKDTGVILQRKTMGEVNAKSNRHVFVKGNVLYSRLRPYLNKVVIADKNGYTTTEVLPLNFGGYIYNKYAQIVLMSPYFLHYAISCSYGVKMPRLGTKDGRNALFPLPPLEEQKRIVAKIEKLMPYVDQYGEAYEKETVLNKQFPTEMERSVLQYAIQGKLVEQREEEGTASELYEDIQVEKERLIEAGTIRRQQKLPDITEEEIPFDIPETWKWVRIGDVFNVIMGQSPKGKYVVDDGNGVEFHQGKRLFGEMYLLKSNQSTSKPTRIVNANTVLLSVRAPVGAVNITERDICIGRGLSGISTYLSLDYKFIYYMLKALEFEFNKQATGTTFSAITARVVRNQLLPLPPLEEQKRIVAKIEEVLSYTKKLVTEIE